MTREMLVDLVDSNMDMTVLKKYDGLPLKVARQAMKDKEAAMLDMLATGKFDWDVTFTSPDAYTYSSSNRVHINVYEDDEADYFLLLPTELQKSIDFPRFDFIAYTPREVWKGEFDRKDSQLDVSIWTVDVFLSEFLPEPYRFTGIKLNEDGTVTWKHDYEIPMRSYWEVFDTIKMFCKNVVRVRWTWYFDEDLYPQIAQFDFIYEDETQKKRLMDKVNEMVAAKRELFADVHDELLAEVMSPDRVARMGKTVFLQTV